MGLKLKHEKRGIPSSNEGMGVCFGNLISENMKYRQFNQLTPRKSTTDSLYIYVSFPHHELVDELQHQHISHCIHAYRSYILRNNTILRMKLTSSTNNSTCITFFTINHIQA
jgi:hypothetical protein